MKGVQMALDTDDTREGESYLWHRQGWHPVLQESRQTLHKGQYILPMYLLSFFHFPLVASPNLCAAPMNQKSLLQNKCHCSEEVIHIVYYKRHW